MRASSRRGAVKALAIAGTHVVALGWDMKAADIRSRTILGFAIQRTRARDGERIWLLGQKTFEHVGDPPGPGVPVSSRVHPFQAFQWSDYTVSPGESYAYRIVAMTGEPGALREGPSATLKVTTESGKTGKHSVFFNRGAAASQEYARRFQNKRPDELGEAAWAWLSRGLVEALEEFIAQAGEGDELHGAIFEFKHPRIYAALKAAKKRKAKIFIAYDGKSQKDANEAALNGDDVFSWLKRDSEIKARKRPGSFAHNKFIVLSQAGRPRQVWTGSTNLSVNGLFGHSNNGHVVRDETVARAFRSYWDRLWDDPTRKPLSQANFAAEPAPPAAQAEISVVFSPQPDMAALQWYAALAGAAKKPLFATFAFGMSDLFTPIYERRDNVLRFALMERKGNGAQFAAQAKVIDRIRRLPNTVVAVGDYVDENNALDRWLVETDRIVNDVNVRFVHTKYMLIDPLGEEPILIVGSANFSKASTDTNDENMLVVRGDKALADIYLGEFMRLHAHYAFRESLGFARGRDKDYVRRRAYLIPGVDWIKGDAPGQGYFDSGSPRALRRAYFSGG
ncbi:MAG: hypothetical protein BGP06_13920 [Rhizobiales bacterium 65-9]|nr:hypothetical protein [Hyphomicrobiales bacterium]OJY36782.1 MAG: hypothetical protein BGP06_13920 [Rhizobiales bacterium 65-9]